ncbi:MAG: hypothetical protein KC613_20775 [Myxococcales bacterium]|nr:hypothetical protein [Myxococcales bacterium]
MKRAGGALALFALAVAGPAAASGPRFKGGINYPVGVQIGLSGDRDGPGFSLGLEASVVAVDDSLSWVGLVGAVDHDWGRGGGAAALALEGGWAFMGAEVGVTRGFAGDLGLRLRAVSPWIFGAVYLGYEGLDGGRMVGGVLFKWPFGME